jgi:hypothetical protein
MMSFAGRIYIDFIIEKIKVKIQFVDDRGQLLKYPKIHASMTYFEVCVDKFNITIDLNWVPNFVTDFIIYFIKNLLVTKIGDFLLDYISTEGTAQVNDMIKEGYPSEVELSEGLTIGMLLTQMIQVNGNRLMIKVDGFSFLKSTHLPERNSPSSIKFKKYDTEGVVMGISQEMMSSILEVYFLEINKNKFKIDKNGVKGTLKTNINKDSFVITKKGMSLVNVLVDGDLEYWGYTIKISFKMNAGLEINTFNFYKNIVIFSITNVNLHDYNFNSNTKFIRSFGPYIISAIEAFGIFFHDYKLPIPHIDLPYNIHLDSAKFRNENGFMVLKVDSHKEE